MHYSKTLFKLIVPHSVDQKDKGFHDRTGDKELLKNIDAREISYPESSTGSVIKTMACLYIFLLFAMHKYLFSSKFDFLKWMVHMQTLWLTLNKHV